MKWNVLTKFNCYHKPFPAIYIIACLLTALFWGIGRQLLLKYDNRKYWRHIRIGFWLLLSVHTFEFTHPSNTKIINNLSYYNYFLLSELTILRNIKKKIKCYEVFSSLSRQFGNCPPVSSCLVLKKRLGMQTSIFHPISMLQLNCLTRYQIK